MSADDKRFSSVFVDAIISVFGIIFAGIFFPSDLRFHFIYGLWCSFVGLIGFLHAPAHYLSEANPSKKLYVWTTYVCLLFAVAVWFSVWSYKIVCPNPESLPPIQASWLPPELPTDCTNITIIFGNYGFTYSIVGAKTVEEKGIKIPVKDLVPSFRNDLKRMPNYSPRERAIWLRLDPKATIGGKTFEFPITPHIENNRLYVRVQVPFSNKKAKVVMDDGFDSELPIPTLWDRNYNTNLCFYEVVNELTNPVLQIRYLAPNVVLVNGIFQEDANSIYESFGDTPGLYTFIVKNVDFSTNATNDLTINTVSNEVNSFDETVTFCSTDSPDFIGRIMTNELYRPIYQGQRAFFKYPSNLNPGIFADWITVIRTPFGLYYVNAINRSQLDKQYDWALGAGYGIIWAGLLWMCFGWIFYRKRFNVKRP